MRVACRTRGGSRIEFEVLEISSAGCMIDCNTWLPGIGERILVKFEGLEALPSEVVWNESGKAGLAFENMLHEAVLSQLDAKLSAPAPH